MTHFKKAVAAVALLPVSAFAQQAPSGQAPDFAPVFASVSATFSSLMTLGLTLAGLVIAGMIGLKLLKKIVSRAT